MATTVDAHVGVGDEPWRPGTTPETILRTMDESGVDTAVLGPIGRWAAVDWAEAHTTMAGWITQWPDRFLAWASVNPWSGQRGIAELRRARELGMHGIKIHPGQQGVSLLNPLLDDICEFAGQHDMPIYVVTGIPALSEPLQLVELARRHPAVTFVMGRSGRTDYKTELPIALSLTRNVVAESAHNDPRELRSVLDRVGPTRLLFSSDFPETDMAQEVRKLAALQLNGASSTQVLGDNARVLLNNRATSLS